MAEYSSILLEKAVDELSKLPGIGKTCITSFGRRKNHDRPIM